MKDFDCISYDRTKDTTIDTCLNCTKKECIGTCEMVRKRTEEGYVIKRTTFSAKGERKESYVRYTNDSLFVQKDPVKAMIFRLPEGAFEKINEIRRKFPKSAIYTVENRIKEIEKYKKGVNNNGF